MDLWLQILQICKVKTNKIISWKSQTRKKHKKMDASEITLKKQKRETKEKKGWECSHKGNGRERCTFKITGNFEYCLECATGTTFRANLTSHVNILEHWNPDYQCKGPFPQLPQLDCPHVVQFGLYTYMKVYEPESYAAPANPFYVVFEWENLARVGEPCNNGPLPRIRVPQGGISLEFEIEMLRAAEYIKYQNKRVWFPLLCYVVWNRIYLGEREARTYVSKNYHYFLNCFANAKQSHTKYTKWKSWAASFLNFCAFRMARRNFLELFEVHFAREFPDLPCDEILRLASYSNTETKIEGGKVVMEIVQREIDDVQKCMKNFGMDHFYEWFHRHEINKVLLTILCAHKCDPESDFFCLKLAPDLLKVIVRMARLFYFC